MIALIIAALAAFLPAAAPATVYEDGSVRIDIGTAVEFSGCLPLQLCERGTWSYAP